MIRKKENKYKIKIGKKGLTIVGSLLILLGIFVVCGRYLYNYFLDKQEDTKIKQFYKEQEKIDYDVSEEELNNDEQQSKQESKVNYIAVIKITKIGLEKGLCKKGSSCNNVNRNIQILDDATYPDVTNGNFILAGHSGNGSVSYFKNLYKLQRDDEISIFYNGNEYKYKVVNQYDIDKTGTANIIRNAEKNTLTLITCRQGTDKQIIYICELVNIFSIK